MDLKPQARTDGLIAERLDDGLVIYDRLSDQAHSLDATAAALWSLADGTRTISQIARAVGLDQAVARTAFDRLELQGLLVGAPGVSRRSMLRRAAGIGAGALAAAPVIETLVIPVAAAHASVFNPPGNGPPPQPNFQPDSHQPGKPLVFEGPTVVDTSSGQGHHQKKKKKKKTKKTPTTPHTHHRPHPKPKPKHKPKPKPPKGKRKRKRPCRGEECE
jgi:hypothetical protein